MQCNQLAGTTFICSWLLSTFAYQKPHKLRCTQKPQFELKEDCPSHLSKNVVGRTGRQTSCAFSSTSPIDSISSKTSSRLFKARNANPAFPVCHAESQNKNPSTIPHLKCSLSDPPAQNTRPHHNRQPTTPDCPSTLNASALPPHQLDERYLESPLNATHCRPKNSIAHQR
jgi:hypothetical protein